MEIRPGPHTLSLQVTSNLPALARAWTIGQTIEALVVRADPARGTVVLQLAEGEVEARSEIPLQPGARLQLTPEAAGSRLLLRVQGDAAQQIRLAALRQALPREAPLAPVFETVDRLLASPPPTLPEPVRRHAHALSQARSTPERLTTQEGLRRALRDSGLLLESRLADPAAPSPATDLKALLLSLFAAIAAPPKPGQAAPANGAAPPPVPEAATPARPANEKALAGPAPGERAPAQPAAADEILSTLAGQVEGALSRIQLHQLQALPDAQPMPQWLFELPVRAGQENETLRLRFEREPGHEATAAQEPPAWRVTLDLSHPEHGALRAVVAWRGGEISTRFFAEREATAEKFRGHLPFLNRRLAAAGIRIAAIEALTGIPAAPQRPAGTPLLSERA